MHLPSDFNLANFNRTKTRDRTKNAAKTASDIAMGTATGAGIGATIPFLSSRNTPKRLQGFVESSGRKGVGRLFNNRVTGDIGKQARTLSASMKGKVPMNLNTPLASKLAIAGGAIGAGLTVSNKLRRRTSKRR